MNCALIEVKYFVEFLHGLVGVKAWGNLEEAIHKGLPTLVGFLVGHVRLRLCKALVYLDVAKEHPIGAHKKGVVMPACTPQGVQHFRPDDLVTGAILSDLFLFYLEQKPNTLHGMAFMLIFGLPLY